MKGVDEILVVDGGSSDAAVADSRAPGRASSGAEGAGDAARGRRGGGARRLAAVPPRRHPARARLARGGGGMPAHPNKGGLLPLSPVRKALAGAAIERGVAARVAVRRAALWRPGAARPRGGSTTRPAAIAPCRSWRMSTLSAASAGAGSHCSARTPSPAARAGGATAGSAFGPQSRLPQALSARHAARTAGAPLRLTQDPPAGRDRAVPSAPDRGPVRR